MNELTRTVFKNDNALFLARRVEAIDTIHNVGMLQLLEQQKFVARTLKMLGVKLLFGRKEQMVFLPLDEHDLSHATLTENPLFYVLLCILFEGLAHGLL